MKSFAIYIPAYQAAQTVDQVLARIPAEIILASKEILVVDNASDDDTQKVALNFKSKHGLEQLHVMRLPQNLGYGGSQKMAYRYFANSDVDLVIMLHADGQYAPESLPQLLEKIESTGSDMLFGSRISGDPLKGGMPLHRFVGNRILTFLQNLFLKSNFSEFHSGYRIYKTECLRDVNFENLSDDYHFDTEILILCLRAGRKIVEVSIPTFYGTEKNYVNVWSYGLQVLITTTSYFLHQTKLRRSLNWERILTKEPYEARRVLIQKLFPAINYDNSPMQDPSRLLPPVSFRTGN